MKVARVGDIIEILDTYFAGWLDVGQRVRVTGVKEVNNYFTRYLIETLNGRSLSDWAGRPTDYKIINFTQYYENIKKRG